nr:MAG TPA: hypothetical protein [Caudoviricetes sp.]
MPIIQRIEIFFDATNSCWSNLSTFKYFISDFF